MYVLSGPTAMTHVANFTFDISRSLTHLDELRERMNSVTHTHDESFVIYKNVRAHLCVRIEFVF